MAYLIFELQNTPKSEKIIEEIKQGQKKLESQTMAIGSKKHNILLFYKNNLLIEKTEDKIIVAMQLSFVTMPQPLYLMKIGLKLKLKKVKYKGYYKIYNKHEKDNFLVSKWEKKK